MQLTLKIDNESIAQKILWLLEHFKKDGLEIKQISEFNSDENEYTEEYLKENWRTIVSDGLKDLDDDYYKSEQYKIERGEYLAEKFQ